MHLETIQHLRALAATHDDTVPVSKALLLDLLDSYEKSFVFICEAKRQIAALLQATLGTSPKYLIISEERRSYGLVWFYAPNSNGYTSCLARAGRYNEAEAAAILRGTSGELSAIRETDLHRLQILHHIDRGYGDNGAILKTLITPALPVSHPVTPVPAVNPVTSVPSPETFDAHGHPWTRHTPGDPCPVLAHTEVIVLLRRELACLPGCGEVRKAGEYAWCQIGDGRHSAEIIGWRYANPPAASPAAPPHPPASSDDTPRSSAPESAPPAP